MSSDSNGSKETAEITVPSPTTLFGRPRVEAPSYSTLLKEIEQGKIKSLELVPSRREVKAVYRDGRTVTVPVFANDQQILRTAEESGTPLEVIDTRQEQAMAGLVGNLALILLIIVGLSFLLRRSAQVANRALGFGRSQPLSLIHI